MTLLEQLVGTGSTPSRHSARDEAVGILNDVIGKLPPDYGKVVRLYDLEERPAEEVAFSMGRSVGAVHMLRVRAHERLRELLGSESRFFSDRA